MKTNTCTIYHCTGNNTRTLTVAAGSETEARRIYRRYFPKNRIKDISASATPEPTLPLPGSKGPTPNIRRM